MVYGVSFAAWTLQVVADTSWQPLILTEFEIGQAMAAIEGVSRLEKPLAEVGTRTASEQDLEQDLLACIESAGETQRVFPWIRRVGEHCRFGYYAEPWALEALDFLDRTDLKPSDRHWISGLLFGYRSSAIQRFISAQSRDVARNRQPSHTQSIPETAHPPAR
jgi:hypothetical protein